MMILKTGARWLPTFAAAAVVLSGATTTLAQTQNRNRSREPVVTPFHATQTTKVGTVLFSSGNLGDDGGIAGPGPVLYTNNTETGSRSQPGLTTPLPTAFMDDIAIPVSRLGGSTRVQIKKLTFAIRRAGTGTAPLTVATDVRAYYSQVTNNPTPPVSGPNINPPSGAPITLLAPVTQVAGIVSLPASASAGFVTQTVVWGDGINTLFSVDLNMSVLPGFGVFAAGISCSGDATNAPNGVRLTSGPDTNVSNIVWTFNPNTNGVGNTYFACAYVPPATCTPISSTFYTVVEGIPDNVCANPLPHLWCIADVNNDNTVSVNDLLSVITNWGVVGPPRPVGDVNPAPFGNCTVNVNDLLAVISAWGACPIPTGGCCPAIGGACSITTQVACEATGGNYRGHLSTCAAACTAGPANDNPAGAFPLVVGVSPATGSSTGDNTNATLTTNPGDPTCGVAITTRDVWFKYTVPSTPGLFGQILTLNTCDTLDPFNDTILSAYTGTFPGTLSEVACNDDACGANGFRSRISTPLMLPGTQLYVRLSSWGTGATDQGPYVIKTAARNITQDDCLGAEVLTLPGTDSDNLVSATQDIAPSCQGVQSGYGKWYKFTMPGTFPPPPPPQSGGTTVTLTTCNSTSDVYDGSIVVYCAGTLGCSALNCVAGSNADQGTPQIPPCTAFQGETVSFCAAPGNTYYVQVNAFGAGLPQGVNGTYTLTATTGATCTGTIDCLIGSPPANDECATAQVVPVGSTSFSNALATPQDVGAGVFCTQQWSKDVWFNYTSATGGTVSVTVTSTPVFDTLIEVFSGSGCVPLGTSMGCVDDAPTCSGCHGVVTFTAVAGTTYKIRVASWANSFGAFGSLAITDP